MYLCYNIFDVVNVPPRSRSEHIEPRSGISTCQLTGSTAHRTLKLAFSGGRRGGTSGGWGVLAATKIRAIKSITPARRPLYKKQIKSFYRWRTSIIQSKHHSPSGEKGILLWQKSKNGILSLTARCTPWNTLPAAFFAGQGSR